MPTSPIRRRYKVQDCDVLVDVSPAPPSDDVLRMVRPGGLVVLNRETRFAHGGAFEIARVPASRIAQENGILSSERRPMGNVAVLGACMNLLVPDGLGFLEEAVDRPRASRLGGEERPGGARGLREGLRQHARAGDTPVAPAPDVRHGRRPLFAVSTTDSLGNHTGGWSLDRPVLRDACNDCALCALFCPEGAIARTDGSMAIDYLYCKGCGICEVVCPVKDAIAMEAVPA